MIEQALKDAGMKQSTRSGRYVSTDLYEFIDPYSLDVMWINDPDDYYMVELASLSSHPHFIKLTKENVILIMMAAQEKGWFEDV